MTYRGLIHRLPEIEYHRQPGLSSTGAKKILKSPAHYDHYVKHREEPKAEFDLGSAVHAKVLGVGAQIAVYPDGTGQETFEYDGQLLTNVLATNGAISTKAAKAFELDARENGLIPVKRVTARVVYLMAESVLSHPIARALLEQKGGMPEVSVFADDPDLDVRLRGRFDFLGEVAVDLKTTSGEATSDGFARSAAAYGYEVQEAHYQHVLELATGEQRRFLFIVVEREAPYPTAVHVLDDDFKRIGQAKALRARRLYAEATRTGIWPAYPSDIQIVRPPMWSVYDYQDRYSEETPTLLRR